MVVTVILGGLLIWSMTQKVEKPEQEPMYVDTDDDWGNVKLKKDPTVDNIKRYIEEVCNDMIQVRQEMDRMFLSDDNPARTLQDLQRHEPDWYKRYDMLKRKALFELDNFKNLVIDLNQRGQGQWVTEHAIVLRTPTEVLAALEVYKEKNSYTQYVKTNNQLNVMKVEGAENAEDYMDYSAGGKFNEDARDGYINSKGNKDAFYSLDEGDDLDMAASEKIIQNTSFTSNVQHVHLHGRGGQGEYQQQGMDLGDYGGGTYLNDDPYDNRNPDGKLGASLGGGGMSDMANDVDIRDMQDRNQKLPKGDTTTLVNDEAFSKASISATKDANLPRDPFQQAPNDQIQSKLVKQVSDLKQSIEDVKKKLNEEKTKDPRQDMTVNEAGGIAAGVDVAGAANYEPAEATESEANETDAVPSKPKPPPIAPEGIASTARQRGIPGFEEIGQKRGRDPFVALNTDPKKSKTVVPPSPSPSPEPELDLTAAPGGTKREFAEPETRKDVAEQDTGPERPRAGGRE